MTLVAARGRSRRPALRTLLQSARLALTHHRVELGAAIATTIVIGISASVVAWRLNGVAMPPGCFDNWLAGPGGERSPDCNLAIQTWTSIRDNEAAWVYRALAFLPILGLTAGVPIVGREIELRTAQTAWSLSGSRAAWLLRQTAPAVLLIAIATSFAALATDALVATQPNHEVQDLPLHGPILVARMLAALAIGVLGGAVVGRTLPAFALGLVVCVGLAAAAEPMRIAWLDGQKTIVGAPSATYAYSFGVVLRAPNGTLYPLDGEVAASLAPAGVADPEGWLYDHGYDQVQFAVTDEAARGWIPYETAAWTALGIAAIAASAVAINRRRPA